MLLLNIRIGWQDLVRHNRDYLLSVRKGQVKYDEIMDLIEKKKELMDKIFENSDLPEEVDSDMVQDIILTIRRNFILRFF